MQSHLFNKEEENLIEVERMNGIIYGLITNHYATYKELRDDYSIDEVLDLYEAMLINLTNKSILINERRRK